jgi:hypothetical protein
MVLVGDFNYGGIEWEGGSVDGGRGKTKNELDFLRILMENSFSQAVDKPTRKRGQDEPHVLDLVITRDIDVSDIEYQSPLSMSDHAVLRFECGMHPTVFTKTDSFKFILDKGDYPKLCEHLSTDWDHELQPDRNTVDEMWCKFKKILLEGMEECIPKRGNRTVNEKKNFRPYNSDLHQAIHRKHRLWNRWIETRTEKSHKQYKIARNKVRAETRKAKRSEQDEIAAACRTNPKKFWKYIRSKSKSSNSIGDLKWVDSNGVAHIAETDAQRADALEGFFSSVFTVEKDESYEGLSPRDINRPMEKILVTENNVNSKLGKLKIDKSPGLDRLYPRVLLETREVISYPLMVIFNKSLETGTVPADWKRAEVVALFKKGSRAERGNYRPVSLTSICCKVLESIARDHIMNHMMENDLLSDKQYGFVKGRSTMLQLLHMLDNWTSSLEEGGQVDAIYTDFEKAFDKVPHKRLISKLEAYGVNKSLIKWIQDFLKDRTQRVRVKGSYSGWGKVTSGIPQGSILGPLLFLLYINDLPVFCEQESGIYLFADDAKIFRHIKCEADYEKLQNSIDALQEWSRNWLLSMNITKCKVISVGRDVDVRRVYSFREGKQTRQLIRETQINDLGVTIDDRLGFRDHIQRKINKAYSMIGLLKRNFSQVSVEGFIMLYKAMVRSHLDYCNSVWAPHRKEDIERLEKVQRRALKVIPGMKGLKYEEKLRRCKLPTLKYRRQRGDMIEAYKIITGKYDRVAAPQLALALGTNMGTRGNDLKLSKSRSKYDLRKYFFTNRVVDIWNSLPNSVVMSENTNIFKNRLDKFWQHQDIVYNFISELSGIGSRSGGNFV